MLSITHRGALISLLAFSVALVGALPLGARLILGGAPTVERLVNASEVICIAEVTGVESEFVDRRILTTYELRADDYIKGNGPSTFAMTVFGGAVEEPLPIAMVFDGMVVLSENQDVVLFLRDATDAGGSPALARTAQAGAAPSFGDALQPVLGDHGVYTVLTDPQTGQRHVTRINYAAQGFAVTPDVNDLVLSSAQRASAGGDGPLYTRDDKLDLLELAGEGSDAPAARTAAEADEGDGPSAQISALRTLEDFRDEVEALIEEGRQ